MSSRQILVIDDEEAIQEILRSCFEELAGWQVLTAGSGREGLEIAIAEQPDAIVLDLMMPGMDGFSVLKELRANASLQNTPVILLSAWASFTSPEPLTDLKVAGIITKPFEPIAMINQVAKILNWFSAI